MVTLRSNERSEAIELIKSAQMYFDSSDLIFKEATGEQSLKRGSSTDTRANTLFPDVLFFVDKEQLEPAVGWELKLPDTDINDLELECNAQDKALRLNTNCFVLWNFKSAKVFYKDSCEWIIGKEWHDIIPGNTRDSVRIARDQWKTVLKQVIEYLNTLFKNYVIISPSKINSMQALVTDVTEKHSKQLAQYYIDKGDRVFNVKIQYWYETEVVEFKAIDANRSVEEHEATLLFAKNNIIRWLNRITFSMLLKSRYNSVDAALSMLVGGKDSLSEICSAFNEATKKSDFFTILSCDELDEDMPETIKSILVEYTAYLYNKDFDSLKHREFQSLLEGIINASKRILMGLFTTPKNLARLMVRSTLENTKGKIYDPCIGSGTIVTELIDVVSKDKSMAVAHQNIWGADKYRLPLQVANVAMSSKDSLNMPNIIYQKDLLSTKVGDRIKVIDPNDGASIECAVPKFDYIYSNLPFIRNERIDDDEKQRMINVNTSLQLKGIEGLALKNDWYEFGIIHLHSLLKDEGTAVVITSNSWLKTKNYYNYILLLQNLFHVKKVLISGQGRWFNNAEVVTTILVLKKGQQGEQLTQFIKTNFDLFTAEMSEIDEVSDKLLLDEKHSNLSLLNYSKREIKSFVELGLSLNVLFNDVKWIDRFHSKVIYMKDVFIGKRGVKSTNDKFFYDVDEEKIEAEYIKPLLKSPSSIKSYYATADSTVFFVRETQEDLLDKGKTGAHSYIERHSDKPKTQSQRLLQNWYQLPEPVYGDFATALNPDLRLYWAILPKSVVVNQRLTVFSLKSEYKSKRLLIHALLNTYFGQFMIEATGFGRGLGVLDTTKEGILDSVILDFNQLDNTAIEEILEQWNEISQKSNLNTLEQLSDPEWRRFNKCVLKHFELEGCLEDLIKCLKDSIKMRKSVSS